MFENVTIEKKLLILKIAFIFLILSVFIDCDLKVNYDPVRLLTVL